MNAFLLAFIHRVLSGSQSYFGYSKKEIGLVMVSLFLSIIYPWFTQISNYNFYTIFLFINFICVTMKTLSFMPDDFKFFNRLKDIHLWESLLTGGFFVYMIIAGYNVYMLCCSVYPALIIHKGLINLGSGQKFFDEATDDPTGKTYSIPILGIKVPRSNTKIRLILAGLSIIAAFVIWLLNWNLAFTFFTAV